MTHERITDFCPFCFVSIKHQATGYCLVPSCKYGFECNEYGYSFHYNNYKVASNKFDYHRYIIADSTLILLESPRNGVMYDKIIKQYDKFYPLTKLDFLLKEVERYSKLAVFL